MDHRILELEDVLEGPVQPSHFTDVENHFTDEAQRGAYFNQGHTAKLRVELGFAASILLPAPMLLPLTVLPPGA